MWCAFCAEIHRRVLAQYGARIINLCELHERFKAGRTRTSVTGENRSGRPSTSRKEESIKRVQHVQKNHFSKTGGNRWHQLWIYTSQIAWWRTLTFVRFGYQNKLALWKWLHEQQKNFFSDWTKKSLNDASPFRRTMFSSHICLTSVEIKGVIWKVSLVFDLLFYNYKEIENSSTSWKKNDNYIRVLGKSINNTQQQGL